MGIDSLKRAVFLDRDGVLNANVMNPKNGWYESPHHPADFRLLPEAPGALKRLRAAGYSLFLVSNQPSYAKGKTSLENIRAIAALLEQAVQECGVAFEDYYYCLHHPESIVEGYGACACRKPSPFFLHQAEREFGVDLAASWMVGDRETDIECGTAAGARTILVWEASPFGTAAPQTRANYVAAGIARAVDIIIAQG
jgi:D-glycero-D-manno-heptose 1,7-bisphosphate phosphatase